MAMETVVVGSVGDNTNQGGNGMEKINVVEQLIKGAGLVKKQKEAEAAKLADMVAVIPTGKLMEGIVVVKLDDDKKLYVRVDLNAYAKAVADANARAKEIVAAQKHMVDTVKKHKQVQMHGGAVVKECTYKKGVFGRLHKLWDVFIASKPVQMTAGFVKRHIGGVAITTVATVGAGFIVPGVVPAVALGAVAFAGYRAAMAIRNYKKCGVSYEEMKGEFWKSVAVDALVGVAYATVGAFGVYEGGYWAIKGALEVIGLSIDVWAVSSLALLG